MVAIRRPQPLGRPPGPWHCPGAGRPLLAPRGTRTACPLRL